MQGHFLKQSSIKTRWLETKIKSNVSLHPHISQSVMLNGWCIVRRWKSRSRVQVLHTFNDTTRNVHWNIVLACCKLFSPCVVHKWVSPHTHTLCISEFFRVQSLLLSMSCYMHPILFLKRMQRLNILIWLDAHILQLYNKIHDNISPQLCSFFWYFSIGTWFLGTAENWILRPEEKHIQSVINFVPFFTLPIDVKGCTQFSFLLAHIHVNSKQQRCKVSR